ncbi:unnamed protein product [Amoebophrya sp. A120]|nr:unnamed protein product [Amoebophrya sp. A120]|eukprot:GSA120T00000149001.1
MVVAPASSSPLQSGSPGDLAAALKEQRKVAYDGLSAPLEKLSVKQIAEFREQPVVSKAVEQGSEAALSLVTEVDNTLAVDVSGRDWDSARRVMGKPGHYINAMRRFPYAVDSGRIPDAAISRVRNYVESGSSPEPQAHPVAHQMHEWLHSAYSYFQLRRKPQVGGPQPGPPGSAVSSSSSARRVIERPGATVSAGPTMRSSYAPSSGSDWRANNHRAVTASANKSAVSTASSSSRPRPNTAAQNKSPQLLKNTRPLTAQPRPKPAAREAGQSFGSATKSDFSTMSTEARRIALGGLPDYEIELEQMRREVRELKSQESKARWDLKRQEKKTVQQHKQEELEELRQWRSENERALKQLMDQKREDARKRDLLESRDYQAFKKERRRQEREADKKAIEDSYLYNRDHANYRQELKEREKLDAEERARVNAERVALDRQLKKEKLAREKTEQEESRNLDRRLEIEKMKKDLLRQKQELLDQVSFAQKKMADTVRGSQWL